MGFSELLCTCRSQRHGQGREGGRSPKTHPQARFRPTGRTKQEDGVQRNSSSQTDPTLPGHVPARHPLGCLLQGRPCSVKRESKPTPCAHCTAGAKSRPSESRGTQGLFRGKSRPPRSPRGAGPCGRAGTRARTPDWRSEILTGHRGPHRDTGHYYPSHLPWLLSLGRSASFSPAPLLPSSLLPRPLEHICAHTFPGMPSPKPPPLTSGHLPSCFLLCVCVCV